MKKFSFFKIASLALVCVMLLGAFMFTALAAEEPTVEIASYNVFYGEKYQLMFAVNAPDGADITVKDSKGNSLEYASFEKDPNPVIRGVACKAYIVSAGVAAQAIDEVLTITVEYNGKTDSQNYSVLQYVYERLYVKNIATGNEKAMFEALLAYANAANVFIDKDSTDFNDYKYVTVVDGTLDGNNATGMFLPDATPFANIVAKKYDAAVYHIEWDVSVDGAAAVRYDDDAIKTLTVTGNMTVTAVLVENAHTHTWDDGVVTTPATCTEAGVKTFSCTYEGCTETKTEVIEALGHNIVTDAAVAPTCTETGLTEGKHCSVCNAVIVEQTEVPATGIHTWGDWNVTSDATCVDAGSKTRECDACGETETETVPATGHTEETVAGKAPTCTETGLTEGVKCSVCGETLDAQEELAVVAHNYVDGTCACGATKVTVTLSIKDYAAANSWANSTKYLTINMGSGITVTATGKDNTGKYYTNGNNWRIYQNENPTVTIAAEHGTIISVKITYELAKTGVLTCNGSNVTSNQVVNINAASVTFSVGNTTAVTNGNVQISAIEVVYGVEAHDCVYTEATCTKKATCTICGKTTGDFAAHTWVDATCSAPKTCSVCNATEGDVLAHNYVDGVCTGCGNEEPSQGGDEPAEPTVVLEITKDDFNSTSYDANNNTKTEGDYSYTSYQVMNQSSTMQWQKSKGYITIASNEFVKLEIKSNAGTFTVTVGGKAVTGTTVNGVTTYDLSNLTGAIKISVGSATGKVDYLKFYN